MSASWTCSWSCCSVRCSQTPAAMSAAPTASANVRGSRSTTTPATAPMNGAVEKYAPVRLAPRCPDVLSLSAGVRRWHRKFPIRRLEQGVDRRHRLLEELTNRLANGCCHVFLRPVSWRRYDESATMHWPCHLTAVVRGALRRYRSARRRRKALP